VEPRADPSLILIGIRKLNQDKTGRAKVYLILRQYGTFEVVLMCDLKF
jgi:hypothetical protein